MRKLLASILVVGFVFSANALADSAKGQKIIIKYLKKPCGFAGNVLATKHTQAQWKKIQESGKLSDELLKICPKSKPIKKKFINHVYDFLFNYASDSGNVPSC